VKKLGFALALVLGMALLNTAMAREKGDKPKREPPKQATGTLVSATLDGGTIKWKLALDGEGEKTFDMGSQVTIMYAEKNGEKMVRMIRASTGKAAEAKGKALTAEGTFVKAETQGNKVVVTIKSGDAEQAYNLTSRLGVAYREGEPLTALSIQAAGGAKARGEKPGKAEGGKRNKENKPPDNI